MSSGHHDHRCINHDPPLVWHDVDVDCREPEEALCPDCYEQQANLNMASKVYQAGYSHASGVFD